MLNIGLTTIDNSIQAGEKGRVDRAGPKEITPLTTSSHENILDLFS